MLKYFASEEKTDWRAKTCLKKKISAYILIHIYTHIHMHKALTSPISEAIVLKLFNFYVLHSYI